MSTTELDPAQVEACIHRLVGVISGAATAGMVVLGHRLGLYRAMAEDPTTTAQALAAASGTTPRYVGEWLLQQTAAGFVTYDADTGTFTLPPEHAAVLASSSTPVSLVTGTVVAAGWLRGLDRLESAFRSGDGVPWHAQDPDVFDGTEPFFGAGYRASLLDVWLPALDGVTAKLTAGGSVADVGCGHGVTTLLLADAFPEATVVGYDLHERSIEVARKRAADVGLAERVTFEVADATGYPTAGYDLIGMFDMLHDLGDPVAAATHARRALAADGTLLLVEPRAEDDLAANLASPMSALSYAASVFTCIPTSLAQAGQAALGAQAGRTPIEDVTRRAGFTRFRELDPTMTNRIYEVRP